MVAILLTRHCFSPNSALWMLLSNACWTWGASYFDKCFFIAAHGSNDSIVHETFSKALKRMMPASHLDIVQGLQLSFMCTWFSKSLVCSLGQLMIRFCLQFSDKIVEKSVFKYFNAIVGGGHIDYWWCDAEYQRLTFEAMLQYWAAVPFIIAAGISVGAFSESWISREGRPFFRSHHVSISFAPTHINVIPVYECKWISNEMMCKFQFPTVWHCEIVAYWFACLNK